MEMPEESDGKSVGDPGGGKSTLQKKTRPTTLLEGPVRTGSPGATRLKDRVSFYEQVWSGTKSPATENIAEKDRRNIDDSPLLGDVSQIERRLQEDQFRQRAESSDKEHVKLRSTRAGDGGSRVRSASTEDSSSNSESFEETFERIVEEGELLAGGAKVVKFERITMHKSVREFTAVRPVTPGSGAASSEATTSRTPSEEHILQDDSAYHTVSHSQPSANGYLTSVSKSSSVTSLAGRFPSEESLRRTPSREGLQQAVASEWEGGSRPASASSIDWYSEYRTQSFHNMAAKLEYVRSRSEYDSHIAEIKGTCRFTFVSDVQAFLRSYVSLFTHL
jgi:nesprin-1